MNDIIVPPPMIISDRSLTIFLNDKPLVCDSSHPRWDAIKEALNEKRFEDIPDLVDIEQAVREYVSDSGDVTVEDGVVYYRQEPMHNGLTERILSMMQEGFDVTPLINFLENVEENVSSRAVNELYDFLEYGQMPITSDGHFLAYKRIRSDWKDCHSGTIDNSIGQVVSMPRNKVDDDSNRTCSHGLHVCSLEYLRHFYGERVVACKINPRDVVSVPRDYNNTKMRVCRYEVVAELDAHLVNPAWEQSVVNEYDETPDDSNYSDEAECQYCGANVSIYDSFCHSCGEELG